DLHERDGGNAPTGDVTGVAARVGPGAESADATGDGSPEGSGALNAAAATGAAGGRARFNFTNRPTFPRATTWSVASTLPLRSKSKLLVTVAPEPWLLRAAISSAAVVCASVAVPLPVSRTRLPN